MTFSERFLAGFALAATIAKDPNAEQAQVGLCSDIAPPLMATARALVALPKSERRARIGAWLSDTLPLRAAESRLPGKASEPRRAYALLAQRSRVPVATWPTWLRDVPLPRAGYAAPARLVSLLERLAESEAEGAWDA